MRFPRLMLAASGLATVALLGSSAAANAAATINGPIYNSGEAGYQIQSSVPFNEVRTNIHIPPGGQSSAFIDLQENINGGRTFALGLAYNPLNGTYSLQAIEGFAFDGTAGVPLPEHLFGAHLVPVATLGAPAGTPLFTSATGGTYYVEVHYSSLHHIVQFVAGPAENNAATLNQSFRVSKDLEFNAPAIETFNLQNLIGTRFGAPGGGALPANSPQASFTRSGITEVAGSNVGGIAGQRITFDFFPLDEAVATVTGGAPTIQTNTVTLEPSPALPGVGSAFGIVTGGPQ
jgi:hypothetical protein